LALLEQQRQYSGDSDHIFTGYSEKALSSKSMLVLLWGMDLKDKASVHGFRSSFRDFCGDKTDFAREHVEACLGHQVGSQVELAYRRQTALEKRRVIMEDWAVYCSG